MGQEGEAERERGEQRHLCATGLAWIEGKGHTDVVVRVDRNDFSSQTGHLHRGEIVRNCSIWINVSFAMMHDQRSRGCLAHETLHMDVKER